MCDDIFYLFRDNMVSKRIKTKTCSCKINAHITFIVFVVANFKRIPQTHFRRKFQVQSDMHHIFSKSIQCLNVALRISDKGCKEINKVIHMFNFLQYLAKNI